MKRLKKLFEDLEYQNVSTYINSGNVIFESERNISHESVKNIESAFEKEFGFFIRFLIIPAENLKKILEKIPENWENNSEQKTDILFLWGDFCSEKSLELIKINPEVDNIFYTSGAIIWHIEKKNYSKSGMNKFIGTKIYKNMTARNVNTVRKLVTLL